MDQALAIDTETTGLNAWTGNRPFAVSICDELGVSEVWEWEVQLLDNGQTEVLIPGVHLDYLNKLFSTDIPKVFWNAKFDIRMLRTIGIEVQGPIIEVQWMYKCLYPHLRAFGLKSVAKQLLHFEDTDEADLKEEVRRARRILKKEKRNISPEVEQDYWTCKAVNPESQTCSIYARKDAERTMLLYLFAKDTLADSPSRGVFEREALLAPYTYHMEEIGVKVDRPALLDLREECEENLFKASQAFAAEAGGEVSITSPIQLRKVLFSDWELTPISLTKKGRKPSTDVYSLSQLENAHPGVGHILDYRANSKALTSFILPYLHVTEQNGVLHSSFNQWGAKTGRFSSSLPNLQQVSDPNSTTSLLAGRMPNMKKAFIPRPGCWWYCFDYSQLELLIFADISREPAMLDAIGRREDLHSAMCETIWGGSNNPLADEAVKSLGATQEDYARFNHSITALEKSLGSKRFRDRTKVITYLKLYGGGVTAAQKSLKSTKDVARNTLRLYDSAFPTMRAAAQAITMAAAELGYIETAWGRRVAVDKGYAYRGINYLIQGNAADLMKDGMFRCASIIKNIPSVDLILTIHDELVFEAKPSAMTPQLIQQLKAAMEDHGGKFSIPLPVDVSIVKERWSEKIEWNA